MNSETPGVQVNLVREKADHQEADRQEVVQTGGKKQSQESDYVFLVTILQSLYLLYMYFFFKTTYTFSGAHYERAVQRMGSMFVHDTGVYQNKVCQFGKIMACIVIFIWQIRANVPSDYKKSMVYFTLGFDLLCLVLAYIMNLNALVYILPLIVGEIYILHRLYISN
jgi:hypothetical protein